MQFNIFAIVSALSLTTTVSAAVTAEGVVKAIGVITDLSAQTDEVLRPLSPVNVFSVAPKAINNFQQIINDASEDANMLAAEKDAKFETEGQLSVCGAFRDFVKVHQVLLNTLIGKHGLLEIVSYSAPFAQILRQLEGVVDSLTFALIELIPACAAGAEADKASLDDTLSNAIDVYNP